MHFYLPDGLCSFPQQRPLIRHSQLICSHSIIYFGSYSPVAVNSKDGPRKPDFGPKIYIHPKPGTVFWTTWNVTIVYIRLHTPLVDNPARSTIVADEWRTDTVYMNPRDQRKGVHATLDTGES